MNTQTAVCSLYTGCLCYSKEDLSSSIGSTEEAVPKINKQETFESVFSVMFMNTIYFLPGHA